VSRCPCGLPTDSRLAVGWRMPRAAASVTFEGSAEAIGEVRQFLDEPDERPDERDQFNLAGLGRGNPASLGAPLLNDGPPAIGPV